MNKKNYQVFTISFDNLKCATIISPWFTKIFRIVLVWGFQFQRIKSSHFIYGFEYGSYNKLHKKYSKNSIKFGFILIQNSPQLIAVSKSYPNHSSWLYGFVAFVYKKSYYGIDCVRMNFWHASDCFIKNWNKFHQRQTRDISGKKT